MVNQFQLCFKYFMKRRKKLCISIYFHENFIRFQHNSSTTTNHLLLLGLKYSIHNENGVDGRRVKKTKPWKWREVNIYEGKTIFSCIFRYMCKHIHTHTHRVCVYECLYGDKTQWLYSYRSYMKTRVENF